MSAAVAMMTTERDRSEEPHVLPLALTLALSGHLVLAVLSPSGTPATTTVLPPLEVELASKPAPPPPPPPAPAPEPAAPEPAHTAARTPHPGARAAAPAAAGKLVGAQGPTSDDDAPLDFVNDPNGGAYGFGVVSRGGTGTGEGKAEVAAAPPVVPAAPPRTVPAIASADDLSEKPRLRVEDPCRGFYPASALVDSASAVVRVVVEASGTVRDVSIVSESPAGEGFGAAARQCLRQQRFSAARDREGRSVATATTIRVRFER